MTSRTLSRSVRCLARAVSRPVAAVGLSAFALLPAVAQEDDNLAVAAEFAADTAFYFGVEEASTGLREAVDGPLGENLPGEYLDILREILKGEGEAGLWSQAVGGDWGLGVGPEALPWLRAWSRVEAERLRDMLRIGIELPLGLVSGHLDRVSYEAEMSRSLEEFGAADGPFAARAVVGMLTELEDGTLPAMAFVVRPQTEAGREHLASQVEEAVVDLEADLPEQVVAEEQRIGDYACHTWRVRIGDLPDSEELPVARGGDAPVSEFEHELGEEDAARLRAWVLGQTLVVGYGWNEEAGLFVLFAAPDIESVPLVGEGQSLAEAETGFAVLAGEAGADGTRFDFYSSREANEFGAIEQNEIAWDGVAIELDTLLAQFKDEERVVAIQKGLTSLQEWTPRFAPEVVGSSVASIYERDGELRLDVLSGVIERDLDLSRPIVWEGLLESDDPVVVVGAINPAQVEASLTMVSTSLATGIPFGSILVEAQDQPQSDMATSLQRFEEWVRSDEGEQAVSVFDRLGERFRQALGQQGGFVLDFGGEAPEWAAEAIQEAGLPGLPRAAWVAEMENSDALLGAWEDFSRSMLDLAEQAGGGERPVLPAPTAVQSDGLQSWFLAMQPLTSPDLMPTVSVDSERFLIGSSLPQQRELVEVAEGASGEDGLRGRYTRLRLGELGRLLLSPERVVQLSNELEESEGADSLRMATGEELAAEKRLLEILETLGDLTLWERAEDGRTRRTLSLEVE